MFTGYSDKVGDFFWELRFNNSREWFNPRKAEFNQLVSHYADSYGQVEAASFLAPVGWSHVDGPVRHGKIAATLLKGGGCSVAAR